MELNEVDPNRPTTPAQAELSRDLGCPNPAWIAYWDDAGFSGDDIKAWFPVTATLSFIPDWAERLSAAGWAPDEVARAQAGASVVMPLDLQPGASFTDTPAPINFGWSETPPVKDSRGSIEGARAALVLVQYLLEVSHHRTNVLADTRALLFAYLAKAGVPDVESAKLGGVTKQRVGAILKGLRQGRPSTQQL